MKPGGVAERKAAMLAELEALDPYGIIPKVSMDTQISVPEPSRYDENRAAYRRRAAQMPRADRVPSEFQDLLREMRRK